MELLALVGIVTVLLLVYWAESINGRTDAPNGVAMVVSTHVMSPMAAIAMAVVFNIIGAMMGTEVAKTIASGIVVESAVSLSTIAAVMIAVIVWGSYAGKKGLPISKSHTLIAGLAGAGIAAGGIDALLLGGWIKVAIGFACSFVLVPIAFMLAIATVRCTQSMKPRRSKKLFDALLILFSAFMCFTHGLNDGQKFMGIAHLALSLYYKVSAAQTPIAPWVIVSCALAMGLGTAGGGWKIIATLGKNLNRELSSWQGFAAQASASTLIYAASRYGVPLSTTQSITGAIVGASVAERWTNVRFDVLGKVVIGWFYTFPVGVFVGYLAASLAMFLEQIVVRMLA